MSQPELEGHMTTQPEARRNQRNSVTFQSLLGLVFKV